MGAEPARHPSPTPSPSPERSPGLALLPVAATLAYYFLPTFLREQVLVQFLPQVLAYVAMGLWVWLNAASPLRLGLTGAGWREGLRWGLITGLALGGVNSMVILTVVPVLGYDITFLQETPHGRVPVLLMVPWIIGGIAIFVELNFRGFLLGRLAILESGLWPSQGHLSPLALLISTLTFAFDPFLVNTFQYLHWIALWDGFTWGLIRLRTGNLLITIIAHAVEVIVMYLAVRAAIA